MPTLDQTLSSTSSNIRPLPSPPVFFFCMWSSGRHPFVCIAYISACLCQSKINWLTVLCTLRSYSVVQSPTRQSNCFRKLDFSISIICGESNLLGAGTGAFTLLLVRACVHFNACVYVYVCPCICLSGVGGGMHQECMCRCVVRIYPI